MDNDLYKRVQEEEKEKDRLIGEPPLHRLGNAFGYWTLILGAVALFYAILKWLFN